MGVDVAMHAGYPFSRCLGGFPCLFMDGANSSNPSYIVKLIFHRACDIPYLGDVSHGNALHRSAGLIHI